MAVLHVPSGSLKLISGMIKKMIRDALFFSEL
jgi:hypothetical protein